MENFIMRVRRSFAAKLGLLVLAGVLAGCNTLRLGYANGDSVAYWWLNGYVDFNDGQKPWIRARINRLLAWHRSTQLREYEQLLSLAQQRIQHKVAPADVQAEYATLKKQALQTVDKALPELADLALSLQPQQLAHLEKKLASNNDKYRKDNLRGSLEDRQARRYGQLMKHAEYWFGNFSQEQQAQIRAASYARPLNNDAWLVERMRRQQELLQLLRKIQAERPARDAVATMLKGYVATSADYFTYAENRAFFDASSEGTAQVAALVINLATPQQKAHAAKRLQKWIEDCRALAAG